MSTSTVACSVTNDGLDDFFTLTLTTLLIHCVRVRSSKSGISIWTETSDLWGEGVEGRPYSSPHGSMLVKRRTDDGTEVHPGRDLTFCVSEDGAKCHHKGL